LGHCDRRIDPTSEGTAMLTTTTAGPVHDDPTTISTIPESTPRSTRAGHVVAITAAIVVAVLLATVLVLASPDADPVTTTVVDTQSTTLSPEQALRRLVARGYVPSAAIDLDGIRTADLQARGLVPGTVVPSAPFTRNDQILRELVNRGVLPATLVQTEAFMTKDLIARGLVPAGSVR